MTGEARILAAGRRLERAETFGDVPPGHAFWYGNANGLVEISVNQGSAAAILGMEIGSEVTMDTVFYSSHPLGLWSGIVSRT